MYKFTSITKNNNDKKNIEGYTFLPQQKNISTKPVYPSKRNSLEYARKVSKFTHV